LFSARAIVTRVRGPEVPGTPRNHRWLASSSSGHRARLLAPDIGDWGHVSPGESLAFVAPHCPTSIFPRRCLTGAPGGMLVRHGVSMGAGPDLGLDCQRAGKALRVPGVAV